MSSLKTLLSDSQKKYSPWKYKWKKNDKDLLEQTKLNRKNIFRNHSNEQHGSISQYTWQWSGTELKQGDWGSLRELGWVQGNMTGGKFGAKASSREMSWRKWSSCYQRKERHPKHVSEKITPQLYECLPATKWNLSTFLFVLLASSCALKTAPGRYPILIRCFLFPWEEYLS